MARKPTDLVQVNLRIRERLRRRLESEAKGRQVSLNYEMTSRLQDTLDRRDLYEMAAVAKDLKTNWEHWGTALHNINMQNDLRKATEALIEQIGPLLGRADASERAAAEQAIEQVRLVINTIDTEAANALRSVTRPGG